MKNKKIFFLIAFLLILSLSVSIAAAQERGQAPKPDLTVTKLEITQWSPLKITGTIKNIGSGASTGEALVNFDGLVDGAWQKLGSEYKKALAPGEELSFIVMPAQDGNFTQTLLKSIKMRAAVDAMGTVNESNENNNAIEIPVSPPRQ